MTTDHESQRDVRMHISRRNLIAGGLSLAALGASSGRASAQQPVRGGTLRLAFSADPAGFDPSKGPSGMSHLVIEQVYSTLMSLGADANPYPDLALRVDAASDGLSYTFHLRPGVTFHNGDPLTAEDVKFTFDRLRAPASGYSYRSQVEQIADVSVVDPLTVKFTLSEVTGPFLTSMAFPGSSIVPKRLVESGHDLNAAPIGSGPFRFVAYRPRSSITFTRNTAFHEAGRPHVDAMEFQIIPDVTALTNAVLSGGADFSNEIPPKDWAAVRAKPELTGSALEGSRYFWLLPNNSIKPMDNPKVRQAIAYAIDRQAIVTGAFFGQAAPLLGGVIPPWSWAHANLKAFSAGPDAARARALLAEAGIPGGFRTSLTVASSFPPMLSMAPIIQANLAAIGIQAAITTMEVPRYWSDVWGPSRFDMTTMYWISPLADPDDFVFNNYACGTPINVQKSCSEAMDRVLREAKAGTSQAARKDAYLRQQQLSLEEMPIVPLVNAWILTAHSRKLKGYVPARTGSLKMLKDAWLDA